MGLAISATSIASAASLRFGPPYISAGNFSHPYGLAVDAASQKLFVADTGHHRWKMIDLSAITASTAAYQDFGYVPSRTGSASLTDPQGIAVDGNGHVYVVNTLAGDVKLYTPSGNGYSLNTVFCNQNPHIVDQIAIQLPRDIAVGPAGDIYLLDSGNKRILRATGPTATSWTVFKQDPSWNNPYGLVVNSSGTIFLADTGNHRILKITASTTTAIGHWGTGRGEFRFPRDVAVDQQGRIYVADTYNHRIQVLNANGQHLIDIGRAPMIGTLEKIVVDSQGRVFALDSDLSHVLAFLGAGRPAPFDAFLRDFVGDPGDEPSNAAYQIGSPDLLIRHHPDVDFSSATAFGLEAYISQPPRYDQVNYVYVALHNRGTQPAADNFVNVYWGDPAKPGQFPSDWSDSGFYKAYNDPTHNTPGNGLMIPLVPAGGVVVAGPLAWRPPAPESALAQDGRFRLMARVTNPYDYPPSGLSTALSRDSNNVTERKVTVVRGPFPTGDQNTLVVRVHYPNISSTTVAATVEARVNAMAAWISETSWGEATVKALQRGPVTLSRSSAAYAASSNNPLIEMTQEVINQLLSSEPALLDGSGPGQEVGRLVLVTNDLDGTADWATTGSWPYLVNGARRYLSVSIHGGNNPAPLFSHGLSHQLGMVDLYAHPNVTFPRPYADGWDNMAKPINGAHPLVWSKELSGWVTAHQSQIRYIPRPAAGTTWSTPYSYIPLHYQETASTGDVVGVAIGLTNGVTSLSDETAFYYVEARMNSGPGAGADSVLPQTGVLMYYVNSQIPQGQGPVILLGHVPGRALNDAALQPWDRGMPGGTGITVQVRPGAPGETYDISVVYSPPATDYDVHMHPGNPNWQSPDIWVDNKKDGYDADNNRVPQDRGNQGIAGEENRVYARVFNTGPARAYDIEVLFSLSEPYPAVGNQGSFTQFKSVFISELGAGRDTTVYVPWTPRTGIDPHTCVRVDLRRLFNDANSANNWAQRNLDIDHSVHGSPYTPVDFQFQVVNDTTSAQLVYFRADGVPKNWTWSLTPEKVLVAPGQMASGVLYLQPPPNAPDCVSHSIHVTGWTPRGDTLVQLGGTTVQVDMRKKTTVTLQLTARNCGSSSSGILSHYSSLPPLGSTGCVGLIVNGCTNPPQPDQDIVVRYEGPDGKPIYHTVHTDANGCFEDFNIATEGGNWTATVETPAGFCLAPATAVGTIGVPLPVVDHSTDGLSDGERRVCIQRMSYDVGGFVESPTPETVQGQICPTTSAEQTLRLKTTPFSRSPSLSLASSVSLSNGDLVLSNLRHIFSGRADGAGLSRGRFTWTSGRQVIVGSVSGLAHIGTHRHPVKGDERNIVPGHWELELLGTVIQGPLSGSLLRASLTLDQTSSGFTTHVSPPVMKGALEGVIEEDCQLSKRARSRRIQLAREEAARPFLGPCVGGLPCLARVAKQGEGKWILNQTGHDRRPTAPSGDPSSCHTYKTWSALEIPLKGFRRLEGRAPVLGEGVLKVDSLMQVLEQDDQGRGEHAGAFVFEDIHGARVEGRLVGLTRAGMSDAPDHLEGRLTGTLMNGPRQGDSVEARYVIELDAKQGRRRTLQMTVSGWVVRGCLEAPRNDVSLNPPETSTGNVISPIPWEPTPLEALPEDIFRPVSALPRESVARFKRVLGGPLTPGAERELRIADYRFRQLDLDKNGILSSQEFAGLTPPLSVATLAENSRLPKPKPSRRRSAAPPSPLEEALSPQDQEFRRADASADQQIDFTEFLLWWRLLPRLGV